MVWIDVETTGLDPTHDQLLEVAMVITDAELEPVAGASYVVRWTEFYGVNEVVHKMHTENGLFEECRASRIYLQEIDAKLADLLRQQGIDGNAPLCGSTIHFDRAFVKRDLPLTHAKLHYRNVDVSSLKELVIRWAPELEWPKKDHHRAMPDIYESIKALRHYRRAFGL